MALEEMVKFNLWQPFGNAPRNVIKRQKQSRFFSAHRAVERFETSLTICTIEIRMRQIFIDQTNVVDLHPAMCPKLLQLRDSSKANRCSSTRSHNKQGDIWPWNGRGMQTFALCSCSKAFLRTLEQLLLVNFVVTCHCISYKFQNWNFCRVSSLKIPNCNCTSLKSTP